jgi:hypothetical protein
MLPIQTVIQWIHPKRYGGCKIKERNVVDDKLKFCVALSFDDNLLAGTVYKTILVNCLICNIKDEKDDNRKAMPKIFGSVQDEGSIGGA